MMELLNKQNDFFYSQQTKSIAFRKKFLIKLKNEIIAQEDAICDAIYADFKKPKFESLATETQFTIAELNGAIKKLNKWAKPQKKSGSLLNWPSSDYIYKEPYGAVLIIAPWNYPFQLALAPLIGAIAAGNTAVIKPSELTPNTSKIISLIIKNVFPEEYVSVVEGGVEVSKELLAQKWDYIFFTGSTRVGKIVYESAAKHLTPVTLELGGKNPTIVDATASLKTSADRIVWGKFLNAGQTCIATDYILVHKTVKTALIDALKNSITKFYGNAIEQSPDFARTVNQSHYENLKEMLEGENIVFGGQTNDDDNYLSPTLVDEPNLESKIMKGEIFGPILPIISYETEEDLDIYITKYGKPLATYIFSENKDFQNKILNKYSFGGGAINDTIVHITNKKLPFGGVGASGIGAYHGKLSYDLFSHSKAIIKKGTWLDIPLRYPPYNLPIKFAKKISKLF
ncbi:aldehyde dehydrogenase [Cellulophaga baltica]|uniref:aldehyde dehydrogenase n=1 Tax=Cellulophaga TaxID=104264 RepID=UPI001C0703E8|nr:MULTISPECIES: aldehyde dehydrogenase [Cellulophaga]MBU2997513.1 aldehyde dehydrogenase [Cellulophaga baltica]MDO6768908.1 aldehyde dehydrogenase [Cellulophaga sp. 1_MG-2023]